MATERATANPGQTAAARTIPFGDLARERAELGAELTAAVDGVLTRGWFVLGPEVEAFEREFAAYCGCAHAIGVASGTDAVMLALVAAGVQPGDEVITTAHTAIATAMAIALTGATPVLADVDPTTGLIDPTSAAALITKRTAAIVPVHLYGQPVDVSAFERITRDTRIPFIEDCAQAHGARLAGSRVGSFGKAAAFSFYPSKNLGAYGDGGAITTNDPELAERLRLIRQYGWLERDYSRMRGYNSRLDELQAAILRVKLRRLDAWNARRQTLAARYRTGLTTAAPWLRLPPERPHAESVYHLFVGLTSDRDELRQHLRNQGIASGCHYPHPIHRQPAFSHLGLEVGSRPEAERFTAKVVSLPLFPQLDDQEVDRVVAAVAEFRDDGA